MRCLSHGRAWQDAIRLARDRARPARALRLRPRARAVFESAQPPTTGAAAGACGRNCTCDRRGRAGRPLCSRWSGCARLGRCGRAGCGRHGRPGECVRAALGLPAPAGLRYRAPVDTRLPVVLFGIDGSVELDLRAIAVDQTCSRTHSWMSSWLSRPSDRRRTCDFPSAIGVTAILLSRTSLSRARCFALSQALARGAGSDAAVRPLCIYWRDTCVDVD